LQPVPQVSTGSGLTDDERAVRKQIHSLFC